MAHDLRRYIRDLDLVLGVAQAMAGERDLDRLLEIILQAAKDLVHADRCSLFLVDATARQLWTRIAHGSDPIRLPLGSGIAGTVAVRGAVINLTDAHQDPRFNPDNDRLSGYRTRSLLCLPLPNREGRVVGVLQALNKTTAEAFDAYDERILQALCSQAAVAVETAQLITRDLERQRLARDMELARSIQQGLLPRSTPTLAGWDFSAWQQPCDQTGGDYHDFIPVADGRLDVLVGDVSGHGIGAALLMSTARAFLRALHAGQSGLPGLFGQLNRLLQADLQADAFMTMLCCRLDAAGACSYVAAGHEPPMVFRAASRSFDELGSTGLMLGVVAETDFEAVELRPLAPGDCLVGLTDGVWEACDQAGQAWGQEALRRTIASHAAAGSQAVLEGVIQAVQTHLAGQVLADDITIVVACRT